MIRKFYIYLFLCIALPMNSPAQSLQDLVSAEVTASRDKVYLNECFQLEISLTSLGLSLDQNLQLLSMPDSSMLVLGEFRELPPVRSMQGNQIMEKRRFICDARAVKAESIDVSPNLRIGVISGFGLFRRVSRHDIKAKALSLSVLPLPDIGKPESFSGAIGQFSIEVTLSSGTVSVGDLITIATTIRGKGYFDSVSSINFPASPNFRVYPPKQIPLADSNAKTFEQILIPQSTNAVMIPALSFCYFDPLTSTYKSISTGPFPITVRTHRKTSTETIYKPTKPSLSVGDSVDRTTDSKKTPTRHKIREMRITAVVTYWLIIFIVSVVLTIRYKKGSIAALLLLILSAIISLPLWNILQSSTIEASVVRNEKARLAPAYSSIACFDISRDALVRVLNQHGTWIKVEINGKRGWMPSDSITNVCGTNVETD